MSIRSSLPAQVVKRAAKLLKIRSKERMAERHRLVPVAPAALDTSRPLRLVLHVGVHKTGSTSIQAALRRDYGRLLKEGVLYPHGIFADDQHSLLFHVVSDGSDADVDSFFRSLRALAQRHRCGTVVLSGESISLLSAEALRRLLKALELSNFDTTVVVFTRSPLGLLKSRLSQWMISYPRVFVTPYSLARATEKYSVEAICGAFVSAFGPERVIRHDLVSGEDAVRIFAEKAGIELPAGRRRNTSADFAVTSFVNAIKTDFELSPGSVHGAYNAAFGDSRYRFTNEGRFVEEMLEHLGPERAAELTAELETADDNETRDWTLEDQVRYLRQFEKFIRHLRRDHAWSVKGRVKDRPERLKRSLARLGIKAAEDR